MTDGEMPDVESVLVLPGEMPSALDRGHGEMPDAASKVPGRGRPQLR